VANARADSRGRRPRYRADSRKARSSVDTALAPRSYPTAINGLNSAGHQPLPFAIIWNVGAAWRRGFRYCIGASTAGQSIACLGHWRRAGDGPGGCNLARAYSEKIVRIVSSISAVRAKAQALASADRWDFSRPGSFRDRQELDIARNAASFCYRRTAPLVTGRKLRPFHSELVAPRSRRAYSSRRRVRSPRTFVPWRCGRRQLHRMT
jgi:hypothetical protein